MSEFYDDEGLTMEQDSPDLTSEESVAEETAEGTAVVDGAPQEEPQQEDTRTETKRVSDRINAIRAEKDARIRELEDQLAERNGRLLTYRAAEEGITEEELAERDRREEEKFRDAMHNDPEFLALQQRDFERQKLEVLTQLQTEFPKDGIEDLDGLPQDFYRLLQSGVSPVVAYRAAVKDEQKPEPPSTGSVKSQGVANAGKITEEQLANMSTEEIVANWDKIFGSE